MYELLALHWVISISPSNWSVCEVTYTYSKQYENHFSWIMYVHYITLQFHLHLTTSHFYTWTLHYRDPFQEDSTSTSGWARTTDHSICGNVEWSSWTPGILARLGPLFIESHKLVANLNFTLFDRLGNWVMSLSSSCPTLRERQKIFRCIFWGFYPHKKSSNWNDIVTRQNMVLLIR